MQTTFDFTIPVLITRQLGADDEASQSATIM